MTAQTFVRKIKLHDIKTRRDVMCMVEMTIDLDRVAEFQGTQALRNKSGRSKFGPIIVTARPCENQEEK